MCKELCGPDGLLTVRCDDCATYLCFDVSPQEMRVVERPALVTMVERPVITGATNLCDACFTERQEEG